MAIQPVKNVLLTPKFRVSFPEVYRKKQFDETQVARYSVVGLFTPAEFTDAEKKMWSNLGAAVNKLCMEHIKKPYKDVIRMPNAPFRMPYHMGEEKTYAGYGPGVIYFTMAATKNRPRVIDLNKEPVEEEDFYPGCYARASVNPYWFSNKGKGIAIGLNHLQKLGDGEHLDSRTNAEDDFADASEYGGTEGEFDAGTGSEDFDDPTA